MSTAVVGGVRMVMVVVIVIPHTTRENTNTTPDLKKMSTFERGMLRYMQGKIADAIAREDEPPWGGLYDPPTKKATVGVLYRRQ
jgi:hypothetical protein